MVMVASGVPAEPLQGADDPERHQRPCAGDAGGAAPHGQSRRVFEDADDGFGAPSGGGERNTSKLYNKMGDLNSGLVEGLGGANS